MKKSNLTISLSFILSMVMIGCSTHPITQEETKSKFSFSNGKIDHFEGWAEGPKVYFRWTGTQGMGCFNAHDCRSCPIGICITSRMEYGTLSPEEVSEGWGFVDFNIENDKIHLIFGAEVGYTNEDGIKEILITDAWNLGEYPALKEGKTKVVVKPGKYLVDKGRYAFGEAWMDLE